MTKTKTIFDITREQYHEISDFINTTLNSTETQEEAEAHIIAHFPAWTAEEIMVAGTYLGMITAYNNPQHQIIFVATEPLKSKDGKFVDDLDYPPRLSRDRKIKTEGEITNVPPIP